MQRITTPTRAVDLFGAGKHGFKNGNLVGGVVATDFNAEWANLVQEEIIAPMEAAGIALDGTKRGQLLEAIRSGAILSAADVGAANAAVVNFAPAIPALVDGMTLWFQAAATNTGATTLNLNGLGVKAVVGAAHGALQGGEIVLGGKCQVVWSAVLNSFVLTQSTGAELQVKAATKTGHAVQLGQFQSSLAGNGYVKIPTPNGDLIFQWGAGTTNASGGVTIGLPIAFTTSVHQVIVTGQMGGSGSGTAFGWQQSTLATINVYAVQVTTALFSYYAIGR